MDKDKILDLAKKSGFIHATYRRHGETVEQVLSSEQNILSMLVAFTFLVEKEVMQNVDNEYRHIANLWVDSELNYQIDRCDHPPYTKIIPVYKKYSK
jgi:hypothetical protein